METAFEQRGRRPAVVFQDDDYGGDLPVVLVVPLTTARAAMRFAGTTLIQPTAENGLRQASVALVFQLRAIDRSRVQERIGAVDAESDRQLHQTADGADSLPDLMTRGKGKRNASETKP